jgi:hypothetical protein
MSSTLSQLKFRPVYSGDRLRQYVKGNRLFNFPELDASGCSQPNGIF